MSFAYKIWNFQIFHWVSFERQNRKVQIGPFYGLQKWPSFFIILHNQHTFSLNHKGVRRSGDIDVGDGSWRRNVTVTSLRCWWRFWPFLVTNITMSTLSSSELWRIIFFCHQLHLCSVRMLHWSPSGQSLIFLDNFGSHILDSLDIFFKKPLNNFSFKCVYCNLSTRNRILSS